MSKRSVFTTVSALPAHLTREAVLAFLHDHEALIDLNPLVVERHPVAAPAHAPEDERGPAYRWWSLTDRISYLPGDWVTGNVTYTAAFLDRPDGVQTHVYAPAGTNIRETWSLAGTLPSEPPAPVEIGIGAPAQGLYIREDVDLRCNFFMAGFVKKTLLKAHGTLVDRLVEKARKASNSPAAAAAATASAGDASSGGDRNGHRNGDSDGNGDGGPDTYQWQNTTST